LIGALDFASWVRVESVVDSDKFFVIAFGQALDFGFLIPCFSEGEGAADPGLRLSPAFGVASSMFELLEGLSLDPA
jgi:hypothetical protein